MKNIHILPTEKPSELYINMQGVLSKSNSLLLRLKNRHIYITNSEEIKEESLTKEIYVIDIQDGNIGKLTCKNRFFKGSCKLIEIEWKNKKNIWNYNHIREIILTTDADLIKDGIQAIDDEFLEWFVNNPSCEEVEVNKLSYGALSGFADAGYKIIIPKEEPKREFVNNTSKWNIEDFEEPKQETLEEAKKYAELSYYGDEVDAFVRGAKWQQERSYSEEDLDAFRKFMIQEQNFSKSCLDVFVEQFKK